LQAPEWSEETFTETEKNLLKSATTAEVSPALEEINDAVRVHQPVSNAKRFHSKFRDICFKFDNFFDIRDENRKTELIKVTCASMALDLRRVLLRKVEV
jgi:hypothetical protein